MKKAEIIIGIVALISLIFNLLLLPGGGIMTVLSLLILSGLYMYLSFAFFNNIQIKKAFNKDLYKGISSMRIVGAILTGLALAATIIGLLFRFQSWPGADFNLIVGVLGLAIALLIGTIKYAKTKSDFYSKILKRVVVYGGLGLIMVLIPKETLLEIKYRNHPEYVNAVKKAMANPDNQELWENVDKERRKMNEEK